MKSVKVIRRKLGVCHVPRHVAATAVPGQNIISIEYDADERPVFAEGVNVFPVTGLESQLFRVSPALIQGLDDWIKKCNGGNIVVHCEMGISRSRAMAFWIKAQYGYVLTSFDTLVEVHEHLEIL